MSSKYKKNMLCPHKKQLSQIFTTSKILLSTATGCSHISGWNDRGHDLQNYKFCLKKSENVPPTTTSTSYSIISLPLQILP